MKLNWFNIGLLLFFAGIFSCHNNTYRIATHDKEQEGVSKGKYIPVFAAPDSTGKQVVIEQIMGKATIIDFWASWCRPCRESANPAYKKLYKRYHSKGLQIIGISSDRHQYFWKKALKEDSLPWTQVIDSTHLILQQFKVKSIPTMLLIDRYGKITGRNLWGEKLEHQIDSLLQ